LIVTYLAVYTLLLSAVALAPTLLALNGDGARATAADAAELFLFQNRIWPVALLLILGCGVHSILVSHRVFGPLTRVNQEAKLIGAGDLSRRIRFRKNDHMAELRDALNGMVGALDVRMEQVHLARARCRHRLEQLEHGMLARGGADRRALLEQLLADFSELESALAPFRTSRGFERLKASDDAGVTADVMAIDRHPGAARDAAPDGAAAPDAPTGPGTGTDGLSPAA
jgi:hypothetical protein